jgi:cytochrome c-type biogenesis protein CcmH/NrfG
MGGWSGVGRFSGAIAMAALLVLYIGLVGWRAIEFVRTGVALGIAIGVALVVVAIIGVVLLVFELRFGFRITRLATRLEREGGTPDDVVPLRSSGRPDRSAADDLFPKYRDAVQAAPEDWRAWFRLGVLYDAAGDRRRARGAMRTALRHAHSVSGLS